MQRGSGGSSPVCVLGDGDPQKLAAIVHEAGGSRARASLKEGDHNVGQDPGRKYLQHAHS